LPNAISITKRHFPDIKHLGDITKLNGGNIPPVQVIAFGSPCQSFSVAGTRTGFAGKSGMFMEAIRIIKEMRFATNGRYPELVLFENVPGLLSSGGNGRDYKTVLEAFTGGEISMPESGRWASAGMVRGRGVNLAWSIKDASKHFRVPQRRRRLFLVCDFTGSGQRAAQILFITKSLSGYFAARKGEKEGTAAYIERSVGGAGAVDVIDANGEISRVYSENGICNPDLILCAGSPQANADILTNLCPTIVSVMHKNTPYIVHPEISGTLCASGAGMSRPAGMASETDLCIVVASLDCKSLNENKELSGTMQSKCAGGYSFNYQNPIRTGCVIRRLTPIECERLMSLPDGYTEYGHDGRLISDSARYQALGNSIVVNVLAYIMQNIAEQLKNEGKE